MKTQKSNSDEKLRQGAVIGASAVGGMAVGAGAVTGAAAVASALDAKADDEVEVLDATPDAAAEETSKAARPAVHEAYAETSHHHSSHAAEAQETSKFDDSQNHSRPDSPEVGTETTEQNGSLSEGVEVLSYERVQTPDGHTMDVAVVNMEGREVGLIDHNLDGTADYMSSDLNNDGHIGSGEVQSVADQHISMQPLQNAVGFDPLMAQNDIPDYENHANTDNFTT